MATPKQNYAQQFRAYSQSADLPASVRTYSIFDPNSNTWRRMTNNGMSPIPVQGQTLIPTQAPVTTRRVVPAARNVRISNPAPTPATVKSSNAVDAVLNNMYDIAAASGINLAPNYNLNLMPQSKYEKFQREIPRSSTRNPINYTKTANLKSNPNDSVPSYGAADSLPVVFTEKTYTPPPSTNLKTIFENSPLGLAYALYNKGYREAEPYVTDAASTAWKYANDATKRAGNTLDQWYTGFLNWLNN